MENIKAKRMLETIKNILKNTYKYNGKSYAIGVYNDLYFRESGLSRSTMKTAIKELAMMGFVRKTPYRLKNAPRGFQEVIARRKDNNKYKGRRSRGYLQAFIYLCEQRKLKEYFKQIATQLKRQTE